MNFSVSTTPLVDIATVLTIGAFVAILTGRSIGLPPRRSLALYLWHSLFCLIHATYIQQAGGDALMYYRVAQEEDVAFSLGTDAIRYLAHLIVHTTGLSFLGTFLVFNIFGSTGLQLLDASLQHAAHNGTRLGRQIATCVVFLPSASFWSAAIGKDALAFLAACLALWASLALPRRKFLMLCALTLMLLVRPHVAAVMACALTLALALSAPRSHRIWLAPLLVGLGLYTVSLALNRLGLNEPDLASITQYIQKRQHYNQDGGSSLDISSMSLPMQLFTYLFRPLPHEAHNMAALAASLDNTLLLLVSLLAIWAWLGSASRRQWPWSSFLLIYTGICWIMLATTTANLGISVRQKWMFLPMLLYACISAIGARWPNQPLETTTCHPSRIKDDT